MAVDLRRSNDRACRAWLENVLLHLEGVGVVEATRERRPPHYHIAVFPRQYASYVDGLVRANALESTRIAEADDQEYRVRSGDSLWTIAKRHGTTVERLQSANDLRGSRIYAGQLLTVPTTR
jgi:protocatechuate 3,4-dioxygenase beta subunit